jgi:hypothetical protein
MSGEILPDRVWQRTLTIKGPARSQTQNEEARCYRYPEYGNRRQQASERVVQHGNSFSGNPDDPWAGHVDLQVGEREVDTP